MHLFLSPHFDDVALSCGGTVAALVAAGARVEIVTIFGGIAPRGAAVSAWAEALMGEWKMPSFEAAVHARRLEDAAAAATLGAPLITLDFTDGAFRGDQYPSWEALTGEVAAADADLPARVAAAIAACGFVGPETVLTGPLSVGRHLDHQIVLAAMRLLTPKVARARGYEDFPYALRGTAVPDRLAAIGVAQETPEVIAIAPYIERKIRAIECYVSQIVPLFGDASMPDAVRAYAAGVAGDGGYAERFWPL